MNRKGDRRRSKDEQRGSFELEAPELGGESNPSVQRRF